MTYINRTTIENPELISDLLSRFEKSWNSKNANEMANLFTEKAEFTDIMGQIAIGRSKIEFMHKMVFERFMKEAVMSHDILYMRNINDNQILVTCNWKTTGHTNPENNTMPDRKGVMQIIVEQDGQDWRIKLLHNLDFTTMYNNIDDYQMKYMPEPGKNEPNR